MKTAIYVILIIGLGGFYSCKKLVQVSPPVNELVSSNVYTSDATAASVLTGMYSNMSSGGTDLTSYLGFICGLSSDELQYYGTAATLSQYYTDNLLGTSTLYFWTDTYQKFIFTCNDVIANLPNSAVSTTVSNQLVGEAKFIRAFCNFYLTNLWGDIPLLSTTNYNINGVIARTSQDSVYQLIKQDLLDAQQLLSPNYVGPDGLTTTTERTIPNQWAATALLARVYLYMGDYIDAQAQSTKIINNSSQYALLSNLTAVFLANSKEAIWQLEPVAASVYDTYDATNYILKTAPGSSGNVVSLSIFLLNSFEVGDQRRINWVGDTTFNAIEYYYAYKYKINSPTSAPYPEYTMILRLAEQYLIRAEAEDRQGNMTGAINDLNMIRNRAGLPDYAGMTNQDSIMNAILHERQVELFTEFGHRWLDMKRIGAANAIMGAPGNVCQSKGGNWVGTDTLYPIPNADILLDKNLTQNSGY